MFKFSGFLLFIFFIQLRAAEKANEEASAAVAMPHRGITSKAGVTYATEAFAREALARGKGCEKNPFVDNVCQLFHSTKEGVTTATITQIAPSIFLACKHTALELSEAFAYFSAHDKLAQFELSIRSGDIPLGGALGCVIHQHPIADLALMKLSFSSGEIPRCAFLPLATPIVDGENGNGFVVSCCDVSIVGSAMLLAESTRTLSIHPFKKTDCKLVSSLPGKIAPEHEDAMIEAIVRFSTAQSLENKSALAVITQTATFTFPDLTAYPFLKFMSVLSGGASGSPLVIKQKGQFRILGILTEGATFPKAICEGKMDMENIKKVIRIANFLDLTCYSPWIASNIEELRRK